MPYFSSTLLGTLGLFLFFGGVLFSNQNLEKTPESYPGNPVVSPSPSASPSPAVSLGAIESIKVKLDGVPSNGSDLNLPVEFREQFLKVTLADAKDGTEVFSGWLKFIYNPIDQTWQYSQGN